MPDSTSNFANLRVAALESRNAAEIARLIEKFGGQPFVSPSMREVPIQENREAVDFANRIITGEIDMMIFLTGVGFRHLLTAVEKHVPRERFLHAKFMRAKTNNIETTPITKNFGSSVVTPA